MVQKTETKLRGRPRKYQTETALSQAMDVFWRAGFAGTSMDDLSEATEMNRPSLYHAFGDKRQLYLLLLDLYIANTGSAVAEALGPGRSLRVALTDFYATVLKVYFSPTGVARGCFLIGTAVTEAGGDEEVRTKLAEALNGFRTALSTRLRQARKQGELAPGTNVNALADLASAVLHSLAIRSRAGESLESLLKTSRATVDLICQTRSASD
jgi:AcrR family transcriptional regulator